MESAPRFEPLRVGDILHGYCGGHFGRDSYRCKRVEAIGADWVVARTEAGSLCFANAQPAELAVYRTSQDYCECTPEHGHLSLHEWGLGYGSPYNRDT